MRLSTHQVASCTARLTSSSLTATMLFGIFLAVTFYLIRLIESINFSEGSHISYSEAFIFIHACYSSIVIAFATIWYRAAHGPHLIAALSCGTVWVGTLLIMSIALGRIIDARWLHMLPQYERHINFHINVEYALVFISPLLISIINRHVRTTRIRLAGKLFPSLEEVSLIAISFLGMILFLGSSLPALNQRAFLDGVPEDRDALMGWSAVAEADQPGPISDWQTLSPPTIISHSDEFTFDSALSASYVAINSWSEAAILLDVATSVTSACEPYTEYKWPKWAQARIYGEERISLRTDMLYKALSGWISLEGQFIKVIARGSDRFQNKSDERGLQILYPIAFMAVQHGTTARFVGQNYQESNPDGDHWLQLKDAGQVTTYLTFPPKYAAPYDTKICRFLVSSSYGVEKGVEYHPLSMFLSSLLNGPKNASLGMVLQNVRDFSLRLPVSHAFAAHFREGSLEVSGKTTSVGAEDNVEIYFPSDGYGRFEYDQISGRVRIRGKPLSVLFNGDEILAREMDVWPAQRQNMIWGAFWALISFTILPVRRIWLGLLRRKEGEIGNRD